jgi:hypothetical protein
MGSNKPVTGLTASSDELVRVEFHNLVFVGFMDQDAVNGRCVCYYDYEIITHKSENALHCSFLFFLDL